LKLFLQKIPIFPNIFGGKNFRGIFPGIFPGKNVCTKISSWSFTKKFQFNWHWTNLYLHRYMCCYLSQKFCSIFSIFLVRVNLSVTAPSVPTWPSSSSCVPKPHRQEVWYSFWRQYVWVLCLLWPVKNVT
jgi:hypothetical protein